MFHIPMKIKSELARASMMTSDVNNQWRSNFQQQKIHNEKFNYIKFWCDLNIIIRIECILLKFHWGMKALIELHFILEKILSTSEVGPILALIAPSPL